MEDNDLFQQEDDDKEERMQIRTTSSLRPYSPSKSLSPFSPGYGSTPLKGTLSIGSKGYSSSVNTSFGGFSDGTYSTDNILLDRSPQHSG